MAGINDIFGYKRNPKPESVFSSEESMLTFGGTSNLVGYLVQQWQANYQQQVQEIFEIGTNALYWVKGRPVGQGTIGRIIGEKDATAGSGRFFPDEAYDLCDGGAMVNISAQSGMCDDASPAELNITMDGVVVTSIGFAMRVQDVMINENIGWRFAALEVG
jgi:hypothetical protein